MADPDLERLASAARGGGQKPEPIERFWLFGKIAEWWTRRKQPKHLDY